MRRSVFALLLAALLSACATAPVSTSSTAADVAATTAAAPTSDLHWYKGNTHTHTLNSDGDSSPSVVARWYRDHDYDFLVISDHCFQTPIEDLQEELALENARVGNKQFLLIPGEETGAKVPATDHRRAIHVNGIGTAHTVGVQSAETVHDGLQMCVDGIRDAGGVAHVNHPNFMWSLTADDLAGLQHVNHFEIANAHPSVHNYGGGGNPSTEEIWDDLLSRGRLYYGIADDDAHTFKSFSPNKANPGRAWIVVRAPELSAAAIVDAIRRGDYYASTGVVLDEVTRTGDTLRAAIHQRSSFAYRTEFIGKGGVVLAADETTTPSYRLAPGDLYARARVTDSGGRRAWTQPLFAPGAAQSAAMDE